MSNGEREQWMLRLGPLYPALLGFRLFSALPVATELLAPDEDYKQVTPLLPALGVAIGSSLALMAVLLSSTPLVAVIAAALLVTLVFFVGGGHSERALIDAARGMWSSSGAQVGSGFLLGIVLVRLFILIGTDVDAWSAALVAAFLTPRLYVSIVSMLDSSSSEVRTLLAQAPVERVVAGIVVAQILAVMVGGWTTVWALVIAGAAALIFRKRAHLDHAVTAVCELVILVVVAAMHPALSSPLIAH
jgi:hypothetical protein